MAKKTLLAETAVELLNDLEPVTAPQPTPKPMAPPPAPKPSPAPSPAMDATQVPIDRPRALPKFGDDAKSRRVQLLMQPALHDRLKVLAAREGRSLNDFVHNILEQATREG